MKKTTFNIGDRVAVYGTCNNDDFHDGDKATIIDLKDIRAEIKFDVYLERDIVHVNQLRKLRKINKKR